MGSAKVVIKTQDRSAIVSSFPGIYAGIALAATKGPVGEPYLITGEDELVSVFGKPVTSVTGYYSAIAYLSQSNKLWTVRAAHADVKFGALLVRSKVDSIPTGFPSASYSADPILKPIAGLTQDEIDSYVFPTYSANRVYTQIDNKVAVSVTASAVAQFNDVTGLSVDDKLSIGIPSALDNTSDYFMITNVYDVTTNYDKIALSGQVTAPAGTLIKDDKGNNITGDVTIVRAVTASNEILVSNSDLIHNGDTIVINGTSVTVSGKSIYSETQHMVAFNNPITATASTVFSKMTSDEFEDRDSFLIYGVDPGVWNNDISVTITASTNYTNGFVITVYYKGVKQANEVWEVTKEPFIDGYGNQKFLEDAINDNSNYIRVKNNPYNSNLPLATDYSIWRQDPVDIFNASTCVTQEDLVTGDTEVKLNNSTPLSAGTRLRFGTSTNEYKVLSKSGTIIVLDRPIVETLISSGAVVKVFNPSLEDAANGIYAGIQYYKPSLLDKVYPYSLIGSTLSISGVTGKLLDCGANLVTGGSNGSTITLGDMINAIKMLDNKEKTPVSLILDGGYTYPAYAQALHAVAEAQGLTHGYISCDPAAELKSNYKTAIVEYKNSLNINSSLSSFFTGWVNVFDSYNQTKVKVAPDGFAAARQAFTTRNYQMWFPAGGWKRGRFEALGMIRKFSEGDRDYFVDNQINPIRQKDGSGLAIWGNETLLSTPSPLQLRSVAMLLIVIKYGLENYLENVTFDLNNSDTWNVVEGAINAFLRDEIQAKGGVYKYQVAVKDVIKGTDLDARRMPVFVGIQPTMDIKEIPVTLAIFNSSVDISVSL